MLLIMQKVKNFELSLRFEGGSSMLAKQQSWNLFFF